LYTVAYLYLVLAASVSGLFRSYFFVVLSTGMLQVPTLVFAYSWLIASLACLLNSAIMAQ